MLRSPFPGHRRYSITHRAVQRLRELVPTVAEEDDEALRDRLDAAITSAEDTGKAVRTLDVMLGEPQILIPLESFGDILYAIIKEDTVVTVLPKGHGEEILQRGQALEQRVAAGEPRPATTSATRRGSSAAVAGAARCPPRSSSACAAPAAIAPRTTPTPPSPPARKICCSPASAAPTPAPNPTTATTAAAPACDPASAATA